MLFPTKLAAAHARANGVEVERRTWRRDAFEFFTEQLGGPGAVLVSIERNRRGFEDHIRERTIEIARVLDGNAALAFRIDQQFDRADAALQVGEDFLVSVRTGSGCAYAWRMRHAPESVRAPRMNGAAPGTA
jgi:hypothetical protein